MNRNLRICIGVVILALAIPFGVINLQSPTSEWPLFWQMRLFLINYSGMTAMILMSLTVILSIKHRLLERVLKGLDKQYQVHKYLGIAAVAFALVHWLSFLSDDLMMGLGYVAFKEERFPFWKLNELVGEPAQIFGEWGFYISTALVLIALIKYFPHHVFHLTHKIFPYLYLVIVLHVIVFFQVEFWLSLPGVVMGVLMAIATTGCILNILNLNGKENRRAATITLHLNDTERSTRLDANDILSVVKDMSKCSVWFCGPVELGSQTRTAFMREGLPARAFHREVFSFR